VPEIDGMPENPDSNDDGNEKQQRANAGSGLLKVAGLGNELFLRPPHIA